MSQMLLTRTVTINAAFLQEIKEVNQELWRLLSDVRRLCRSPLSIYSSPRRFANLVEELRDQVALHFALEEAYGYFEDPVFVAPRLCRQAEMLRAEHRELYLLVVELGELSERLLEANYGYSDVLAAVRQFQNFDVQLREHEALENELIQSEYEDDIGVGD